MPTNGYATDSGTRDRTTNQNTDEIPNRMSPAHSLGSRAARETVAPTARTSEDPMRPMLFIADFNVTWPAIANPMLTTSNAMDMSPAGRVGAAAIGSGLGNSRAIRRV